MKKCFVLLWLLFAVLFSSSTLAAGQGFVEYGTGQGELNVDLGRYSDWDEDLDADVISAGLVFDSAPADESRWNYRLLLGWAEQNLEPEYWQEMEGNGISLESTFGYALVQQPDFRWWVGPLFRLGYYWGDSLDRYRVGSLNDNNFPTYTVETTVDFDYLEYGVGLATGVNFEVGDVFIAPSFGVRYCGYRGEMEISTEIPEFKSISSLGTSPIGAYNTLDQDPIDDPLGDIDLDGHYLMGFVNLAVLF